ncbi:MAG: hypothetical protein ABSC49_01010 [Candidatus Microgenomates bacterium]|jgi:hypothetical protein
MEKNKLPNPITILILTLLTTVVWIIFSIYRAITIEPVPSVPQDISQPLTPTLDKDAINKIESSIFFTDSQIPEITIAPIPTTAPEITSAPVATETPIATESAVPTATP